MQQWLLLSSSTVQILYFLFGMEWLFFITADSFLNRTGAFAALTTLFLPALPPAVLACVAFLLVAGVARVVNRGVVESMLFNVCLVIPSVAVTASFVLLVDNFTRTVLHASVLYAEHPARLVFGSLYSVVFVITYRVLHVRLVSARREEPLMGSLSVSMGLVGISVVLLAFRLASLAAPVPSLVGAKSDRNPLPNIYLIGSDMMEASHMSIYGYERPTTPFLETLKDRLLIVENMFSNANQSAGTIMSILTGKLPSETRVLRFPDQLQGDDSFQHLPGILRRLGYRSAEISCRDNCDAFDLNMRLGFAEANYRSLEALEPSWLARYPRILNSPEYALTVTTLERLKFRIQNAFALVERPKLTRRLRGITYRPDDDMSFQVLTEYATSAPSPHFVHVHLVNTHGPRFVYAKQKFSDGQSQDRDYMDDFYDDAILTFDGYVSKFFSFLEQQDSLQRSVVIIYSDHGRQFRPNVRLPLLFYFPAEPGGKVIRENAESADIAPTILDYLGIEKPPWMSGVSLLSDEANRRRSLMTFARIADEKAAVPELPDYPFSQLSVIRCQWAFTVDLRAKSSGFSKVVGHGDDCSPAERPPPAALMKIIEQYLMQKGYDTSWIRSISLPKGGDGSSS